MEEIFSELIAFSIFGAVLYGVAFIWCRISKRGNKNENGVDTSKREDK